MPIPERWSAPHSWALLGYVLSYAGDIPNRALLGLPLFVALPASVRLYSLRPILRSTRPPSCRSTAQNQPLILLRNSRLVIFATGLFLFQLANASVLPLAGEALVRTSKTNSSLIISALIIVPQVLVALMAPWAGRQAQSWGRRRF